MSRGAAGRLLCIDRNAADKLVGHRTAAPSPSELAFDGAVLIVGQGVPAFRVEHVGAALKARRASGYWLVEVQARPRPPGSGTLAETLVGFPGLHIERIASLTDL